MGEEVAVPPKSAWRRVLNLPSNAEPEETWSELLTLPSPSGTESLIQDPFSRMVTTVMLFNVKHYFFPLPSNKRLFPPRLLTLQHLPLPQKQHCAALMLLWPTDMAIYSLKQRFSGHLGACLAVSRAL